MDSHSHTVDGESASSTKIKFKFDDELELAPPSGIFIINGSQ